MTTNGCHHPGRVRPTPAAFTLSHRGTSAAQAMHLNRGFDPRAFRGAVVGADGETRTLTDGDLNAVPLPVGLRRRPGPNPTTTPHPTVCSRCTHARSEADRTGMRVWEAARVLISELGTPALVADSAAIDRNVATMAAVRPGLGIATARQGPQVHGAGGVQAEAGHTTFTCATPREVIGMAAAGLGDDLLLANETVDAAAPAGDGASSTLPVTVAVDSRCDDRRCRVAPGSRRCLIDVNVGLPRCGIAPGEAGATRRPGAARRARSPRCDGLRGPPDDGRRPRSSAATRSPRSMALLLQAHADVGGDIVSAGGTGTYDLHDR